MADEDEDDLLLQSRLVSVIGLNFIVGDPPIEGRDILRWWLARLAFSSLLLGVEVAQFSRMY